MGWLITQMFFWVPFIKSSGSPWTTTLHKMEFGLQNKNTNIGYLQTLSLHNQINKPIFDKKLKELINNVTEIYFVIHLSNKIKNEIGNEVVHDNKNEIENAYNRNNVTEIYVMMKLSNYGVFLAMLTKKWWMIRLRNQ